MALGRWAVGSVRDTADVLGPARRRPAAVAAALLTLLLLVARPDVKAPDIELPFLDNGREVAASDLSLAHFEPNIGQSVPGVEFIARSGSVGALFRSGGVEFAGPNGMFKVTFPGRATRDIEGVRRLPSVSHYLVGRESQWRTGVPHFAAVAYRDLYPGIDVIFRDAGDGFEYDVLVAPGASPSRFRLAVPDGGIELDRGNVILGARGLRQSRPFAYQEVGGEIRQVGARYELRDGALALSTGRYDRELPLVIDPVLTFSTYFGSEGPSDNVEAVAVDDDNNVYVTGSIDGSASLPVTKGAFQTAFGGASDAFVSKIDSAGRLLYSTYFGGTNGDGAEGLDIGSDGSAYVSGTTFSPDLPVTPGAFQPVLQGDVEDCLSHCPQDAFVMRLSPDGSDLIFSTFLGGLNDDIGGVIKVAEGGDAYVAGMTSSPTFPVTPGAFDEAYNEPTCFEILCDMDGFVARLSSGGDDLQYSTFFGGTSNDSPQDMDLDAAGNVYVAGAGFSEDLPTTEGAYQQEKNGRGDLDFSGFVASLAPQLNDLRYATYLGGRSEELINSLAVEPSGEAWVAGTGGRGIPTTDDALQARKGGASDAFVTRFSADGSSVLYSTFFGGEGPDYGHGVVVDDAGKVKLFGSTTSEDLYVRRALQQRNAGSVDLFLMSFEPGKARPQSATYLGGEQHDIGTDIAIGPEGWVYLVGSSGSSGFPLAGAYLQRDQAASDGVILRIGPGATRKVRVGDARIERDRTSIGVGVSFEWRFPKANRKRHRVMDLGAGLFDSGRRPPGSSYHFMLPAGVFKIADPVSGDTHKVRVVPAAAFGDEPGTIAVRWARMPLGEGFVFDVQARRGDAPFEMWLEGTTELSDVLENLPGDDWFRARVRDLKTGAASRWSPPASLSEGG